MTQTNPPPSDQPRRQPETERGEHAAETHGATQAAHHPDQERATREHRTREYTISHDPVPDHTARDSFIGTDERIHGAANVSWGAIFAGVVTFIALMFVFGLVSLGLGFQGVSGMAVGIWSAVALLVALAIAGFVAGMLAVRAGFLHGIGTWATSIVAILLLIGWLGTSVLGAVGGAVGNVVQGAVEGGAVTTDDLGATAEDPPVDQQELDQTQQQLEDTTEQAQDEVAASAWWAVGGLLVGGAVAGLTGAAGSRSVHTKHGDERDLVR